MLAPPGFDDACTWLKQCLAQGPRLLRPELLQARPKPGHPRYTGTDQAAQSTAAEARDHLDDEGNHAVKRARADAVGPWQSAQGVHASTHTHPQPAERLPAAAATRTSTGVVLPSCTATGNTLCIDRPPQQHLGHPTRSPLAPQPVNTFTAPAGTQPSTNKWAFQVAQPPGPPTAPCRPATSVVAPIQHSPQQPWNQPGSNGPVSYPACLSLSAQQPSARPGSVFLARLEQEPASFEEAGKQVEGAPGGPDEPRWTWLTTERKDAQGRSPHDPLYDPTTLHVPDQALRAMSNFNRQFWQLKHDMMDVVLFVRHGSFYNLFDVDADVGLRVGLALSGPRRTNMWKVGCTKDAFPTWCARVLALGYNVGRVEEVHQKGGAGAVRGSAGAAGGGGKAGGGILQRKLVRIYTPSTALDICGAEDMLQHVPSSLTHQPVLSLVEASGGHLGVALLHTAEGVLEVGQLPPAPGRTQLHTLLLRHTPAEVVAPHTGLSPTTVALLTRHATSAHAAQHSTSTAAARPSCTLLKTLPARAFLASNRSTGGHTSAGGFSPCSHVVPLKTAAGQVQHAFAHCQGLLSVVPAVGAPGQAAGGHQEAEQQQGPAGVLRVLSITAACQPLAVQAAAVLLQHLQRCSVLRDVLTCVTCVQLDAQHSGSDKPGLTRHLALDHAALTTLEVLEGSLGGPEGSLLGVLDCTVTLMGRRKLKQWLCRPLSGVSEIEERLQVVELFMRHPSLRHDLQGGLALLPDLPKLLVRGAKALDSLVQPGSQAQDHDDLQQVDQRSPDPDLPQLSPTSTSGSWVVALQTSQLASLVQLLEGLLAALQTVHNLCMAMSSTCPGGSRTPVIQRLVVAAEQVLPIMETLLQVFELDEDQDDEAPAVQSRGIQIRQGACPEYDTACEQLAAAEQHVEHVMDRLKQQLVNLGATVAQCKRMQLVEEGLVRVPATLEPFMSKVGCGVVQRSGASLLVHVDHLTAAAQHLSSLQCLRDQATSRVVGQAASAFRSGYAHLRGFLDVLAAVDVLTGWAVATSPEAAPQGCTFCRPVLVHPPSTPAAAGRPVHHLQLDHVWHPCLPAARSAAAGRASGGGGGGGGGGGEGEEEGMRVVPNTVALGGSRPASPLMLLLTGANMGGKSTLLRSTCLAVIMAHLGCYVPASNCHMTLVDSIFTRMGAHDRIVSGESTFMVEMSEAAAGLLGATPASLVVLDELGRGTATHDGYALAYAVLWYLGQHVGSRTLFATHYHDLNRELSLLPLVSLAHMAHTTTPEGGFLPLHTLRPGPALQGSSGIDVAGLAGLPPGLLARARQQAAALARRMHLRHQAGSAPGQAGLDSLDAFLGGTSAAASVQRGSEQPLSTQERARIQEAVRTLRAWLGLAAT